MSNDKNKNSLEMFINDFQNADLETQRGIKEILNENKYLKIDNVIPRDATPFYVTYGLKASNMQNYFNLGFLGTNPILETFYALKTINKKMFITTFDIKCNIVDTTTSTNFNFVFKIFNDNNPATRLDKTLFRNPENNNLWGSAVVQINTADLNTYVLKSSENNPFIVNRDAVFELRGQFEGSATYSATDTYTGQVSLIVGGYLGKEQ